MDAQTQLVAELYKTLNDAQKQEVCNMIDTLLSQQLKDQQSLDSHSAATENQDTVARRVRRRVAKNTVCEYSESCFTCPLSDCKQTVVKCLTVNRLPIDPLM